MITYPPGVTCELVVLRFEQYLVGALSWAEGYAVAEHLEACPECSQRLVLIRLTVGGTGQRKRHG
jgi:anti-sigma factor ChrR (cupin superfamily)